MRFIYYLSSLLAANIHDESLHVKNKTGENKVWTRKLNSSLPVRRHHTHEYITNRDRRRGYGNRGLKPYQDFIEIKYFRPY